MDVAFAAARDRLGQTLCGKYLLEEVVGVGGTAVVYRASHRNGHKVAVKMLHEYLCKSREVSRRFMREGYLANILDHPGTVRVLDDDTTDDGVAFLVLEMLEGETLEERRVRLGGVLSLDEVLSLTDQLLSVLQAAHEKNIVHRDIKPSNLFLTTEGVLKVLDFGIARLVNEGSATATKTGTMIGTPAFMPPEQALSKPREIDAKSDIWSVGATMFTLLSGELVHIAESSSEHLVKAATMKARSVAKVLPGVPENVEALIAKAMFFNKSERWASALEMRQELWRVRLEPGRPIGTASFPPPQRAIQSNFPTFVDTRESGLSKPAIDSGAYPRARPRKRILVIGALAAMALVVVGASFAAYETASRKHSVAATESLPDDVPDDPTTKLAEAPTKTSLALADDGTSAKPKIQDGMQGSSAQNGAGSTPKTATATTTSAITSKAAPKTAPSPSTGSSSTAKAPASTTRHTSPSQPTTAPRGGSNKDLYRPF